MSFEHKIVVTESVCPVCTCGFSPPSPTANMEGLWRSAIAHVEESRRYADIHDQVYRIVYATDGDTDDLIRELADWAVDL